MRLSKQHRRRWAKLVRRLKVKLPTKHPVRVRTRLMKSHFGLLSLKDGVYRLTIGSNADFSIRVDSLSEEYAHALDGWKGGDDEKYDPDPHRDSWGICLAKVRRAIDEILTEIE